jgi:crossover junction endodeoxyribonuclease RusA
VRKPQPHERFTSVRPYLLTKFTVEGEPVAKARPRWAPRGHTYTPRTTAQGEAHVRECCFVAQPMLQPYHGLMLLKTEFHMARRGRSDIDNLWKLVADALNGIAWHDDAQVIKADAEMFLFAEHPRTEVEVWLIAVRE